MNWTQCAGTFDECNDVLEWMNGNCTTFVNDICFALAPNSTTSQISDCLPSIECLLSTCQIDVDIHVPEWDKALLILCGDEEEYLPFRKTYWKSKNFMVFVICICAVFGFALVDFTCEWWCVHRTNQERDQVEVYNNDNSQDVENAESKPANPKRQQQQTYPTISSDGPCSRSPLQERVSTTDVLLQSSARISISNASQERIAQLRMHRENIQDWYT
eukprot:Nitzschia sp. Nitz4//scaffold146_size56529//44187//44990//NITZ4_006580-RA/size56529-exonerate_est2genome-gene-0.37-mRNA-1//-1//CDS//3329536647//3586//frame0